MSHFLLVVVLVLGQVGGWLHVLAEHAAIPVVAADTAPPETPDAADHACLVCLSYAALSFALAPAALVFALAALGSALPAGPRYFPPVGALIASTARGPPRFS